MHQGSNFNLISNIIVSRTSRGEGGYGKQSKQQDNYGKQSLLVHDLNLSIIILLSLQHSRKLY